jgi:hypothetical protein
MGPVDRRYAGTASGINNAASRVAALVAVAAASLLFLAVFGHGFEARLAARDLPEGARDALVAERASFGGVELPEGLDPATRSAIESDVAAAFVAGFRAVMVAAALLAIASAASAAAFVEDEPAAAQPSPSIQ